MNALQKDKAKVPVRPSGKQASAHEMLERAKTRWPKRSLASLTEPSWLSAEFVVDLN